MKLSAASTLAGLALVAGLATGCGGGGGATDASEQDFCDSFTGIVASLQAVESGDVQAQVEQLKESVGELEETGTPEGIPDDARAGFEQFTGLVADLDDDVSEDEIGGLGEDLSDGEEAELEAFQTYASDTCAAAPTEGEDAEQE